MICRRCGAVMWPEDRPGLELRHWFCYHCDLDDAAARARAAYYHPKEQPMKTFDTLTHDELIALDADQINTYIDLACAEAGVPLLGSAPIEPNVPKFEHDSKIYDLKWGYSTLAHFGNLEHANAAMLALSGLELVDEGYVSGPSYEKTIVRADRALAVEVRTVYSEAKGNEIRHALAAAKELSDAYTKAKTEWEKSIKLREDIAADIRARVREAERTESRKVFLRREFGRYVELADGNQTTAARFLVKAYPDAREVTPDIAGLVDRPALVGAVDPEKEF